VEYTEGAVITPEAGTAVDFTNPVSYSLSFMGFQFSYQVTVIVGEEPNDIDDGSLMIYDGENVAPTWDAIGEGNVTVSQVANPETNGINKTGYCVSMVRPVSAPAWSFGALWSKVDIDPAIYNRFSLMVKKNIAGRVKIEIQPDNAGLENDEYTEADLGEWKELFFDIPAGRTAHIETILVMPHDGDISSEQTMYWDQLKAMPK
jgi:hypothetical protein